MLQLSILDALLPKRTVPEKCAPTMLFILFKLLPASGVNAAYLELRWKVSVRSTIVLSTRGELAVENFFW